MKRILFFSFIVFLFSCKSSNKSENGGSVGSPLRFDTIMSLNRFYKWDATRQITDSTGVRKELFYKNGMFLLEKDYERAGVLGTEKEYYASGNIKRRSFFVQNKYYGDTYLYHDDGSIIAYLCYDFSQRIFRRKYYNEDNAIISNEGRTLGQVRIRSSDSTWKLGEDVVIYFVRTLAPNEKNDYKMFLFDKEKVKAFQFDSYKNTIVFNPKGLEAGSYKVMLTVENIDTTQKTMKNDTSIVEFAIR